MVRIVQFVSAFAFTILMASNPALADGEPGEFDYYTLVLSWSPTYCEEKRQTKRRNDPQCSARRPYAFIVHGFWPQYELARGRNRWPSACDTGKRPWIPRNVINEMLDIMPSKGLIIHEYREHGTCSGLAPGDYFSLARKAYDAIRIPRRFQKLDDYLSISPAQIEKEFLDANPDLRPDMISIDCKSRRLRELRICFTRGLELRDCGPNEHQPRLCSSPKIVMPPVR